VRETVTTLSGRRLDAVKRKYAAGQFLAVSKVSAMQCRKEGRKEVVSCMGGLVGGCVKVVGEMWAVFGRLSPRSVRQLQVMRWMVLIVACLDWRWYGWLLAQKVVRYASFGTLSPRRGAP
jgi:hypothetical protein